ncbi:MAG: hypothetical protein AAFY56_05315, partial [Pseudomonadota bacterium]
MPAASVRPEWLAGFEARNSAARKVLDHANCRFILIDSPSLNADKEADDELFDWLETTLAQASGRRVFVATHYPVFLHTADEPSHYDNIDEPARARLLTLFEHHNVEAAFTGHIHNLFWHRRDRTDFYGVPSLSFIRRDYSELFRVGPLAEDGREDQGKIGFFLIDVHEHGHVARFLRLRDYAGGEVTVPAHVAIDPPAPFGVDFRHPWAETVAFPFNPPTDAFQRKSVRNDYQVQALIELGIKDVRVPIQDLEASSTRTRLDDLSSLGIRCTAFTTDVRRTRLEPLLEKAASALDTIELIGLRQDLISSAAERSALIEPGHLKLMLNELRPPIPDPNTPLAGKHKIDVGQSPRDLRRAAALLEEVTKGPSRPGLVFQTVVGDVDTPMLDALGAFANEHKTEVALHVAWAATDMSSSATDERRLTTFIERLFTMPAPFGSIRIFLDTFMDIDRGYHVRRGLIDRRANFTQAGLALRTALAHRKV